MTGVYRVVGVLLLLGGCSVDELAPGALFGDPIELDLGSAAVSEDGWATAEAVFANVGQGDLTVDAITLAGEVPEWLSVSTPSLPLVMEGGDIASVELAFSLDGVATWTNDTPMVLVVEGQSPDEKNGCNKVPGARTSVAIPVRIAHPEGCDQDLDGVTSLFCGGTDCDDGDALVNPDAVEICNGIDDDCNGEIDDDPEEGLVAFSDSDGDGFGDPSVSTRVCTYDETWVEEDTDCDDADPEISPLADEVCDGRDNNCDGVIDDDAIDRLLAFRDADEDGFGDSDSLVQACEVLEGYTLVSGDCDDENPLVSPDGTEVCGGGDEDCDGLVDEPGAEGEVTGYRDADEDGVGVLVDQISACEVPEGYVLGGDDCDDGNPEISPLAEEVCDGVDNDCDTLIDEDTDGLQVYYQDLDGDGYGNPDLTLTACELVDGWSENPDDCNDDNGEAFPGTVELCNGEDDDCDGVIDNEPVDGLALFLDADEDGYGDEPTSACALEPGVAAVDGDCDDGEPSVNPGADEQCDDGLDNDCNGIVDDAPGASLWYEDVDGDGIGETASAAYFCADPADRVVVDGDCDDAAAETYPGADEVCDGEDNDCDGSIDEGALDTLPFWVDADGDGFGFDGFQINACEAPNGYAGNSVDCNDADPTAFPGAEEICDGDDEDCDGLVDEPGATGEIGYFIDSDEDGFGDEQTASQACAIPDGAVVVSGDCNDGNAFIYPGADELCDGQDNDCDEEIDENPVGDATWYRDLDEDGFGDPAVARVQCEQPDGYVQDLRDCNDSTFLVNPDADEICDDRDNDCDEEIDEDPVDAAEWYRDADEDTYGDPQVAQAACEQPEGFLANGEDCNDGESSINPGASEVCDGADNDCDGGVDEDTEDGDTWYPDDDGDGFGDENTPLVACQQPPGTLSDGQDCDDGAPETYPGAPELCDNEDNDCNGLIDDDADEGGVFYRDEDGDDFGDAAALVTACIQPPDTVADSSDCNDDDDTIYPGADETCDGADEDCDGAIDEGAIDGDPYAPDEDDDGFGDASGIFTACSQPPDAVAEFSDCDDGRNDVYPGAPELCDGADNDCDTQVDEGGGPGQNTFWEDDDGDGFGDPAGATTTACTPPSGFSENDDDCDDTYNLTYPGAQELCDGEDNNCDGIADDPVNWYRDEDGDGYGDPTVQVFAQICAPPEGFVRDNTDCADFDFFSNPDADEVCDDIDNDCDEIIDEDPVDEITWYRDADFDGWGTTEDSLVSCDAPGLDWVELLGDCDDDQNNINPGAAEECDGIDNDCDGQIDDGGACPCPVATFEDHVYAFCYNQGGFPYALAQVSCASYGYTLASINSAEENTFIWETAVSYSDTVWWAGYSDELSEGTWLWDDGSPTTYTNWAPGEPNNATFPGEDCMELNRFADSTWNDAFCFGFNAFVCESEG